LPSASFYFLLFPLSAIEQLIKVVIMRGFHVLTFEKSLQFYGAFCGLGGEAVKTNPRLLKAHSPDLCCELKGISVQIPRFAGIPDVFQHQIE